MKLSKINWSLVVRDGLLFGVTIEAILSIISVAFSKANLDQGLTVAVAGVAAGIGAVVSAVARYFAVPVPAASVAGVDVAAPATPDDPTTASGLAALLEVILSKVSPGTSSSQIAAFLAELTGLASFFFGVVNPHSTFSQTDQTFVTLGGLGFLVAMAAVHMFLGNKATATTQTVARDILNLHLAHRADALNAAAQAPVVLPTPAAVVTTTLPDVVAETMAP